MSGPGLCIGELGVAAPPPRRFNRAFLSSAIAVGTFFVVLCCLFSVLFVLLAINAGVRAERTRDWLPVEGRILSTGIAIELVQDEAQAGDFESYERAYRPYVIYEYAVDGVARRGRTVARDTDNLPCNDRYALGLVERYPVDGVVAVHHDPADPARAVLEPGPSRATLPTICVLLVMAALFALIAVLIANVPPSIPAPDFRTPD